MEKELSKIPRIKKYIMLDPAHPGTLSKQRYTTANGKKSKYYYLWQSSILGEKKSIRVPKESVGAIKEFIDSAKDAAKRNDSKTISIKKSYDKALELLIEKNREIRAKNKSGELRKYKDEKSRKKDAASFERLKKKNASNK